jgi:anti-sigma regulatory factor (Ser/Thr protein kinase)
MPDAEVTLPGATSSVPAARHFVESILNAWGQPESGWTAALLISELSANCALHARTSFTVRVELVDASVRLAVTDGSRRAPAVRDYGAEATTGRGLRMVGQLATEWGVDLHEDGKTVWALIQAGAGDGGRSDAEVDDLDGLLTTLGGDGDGDGDASGGDVTRLLARPAQALRRSA